MQYARIILDYANSAVVFSIKIAPSGLMILQARKGHRLSSASENEGSAVQRPSLTCPDSGNPRRDSWYVAQVKPRSELRAARNLEFQRFTVFCPCLPGTIRHARRTTTVRNPVFPGYVFVQLDISRDAWRRINGTTGVVRLIAPGDIPQSLPDAFVDALQSRMTEDGLIDLSDRLAVGQQVRITGGPFSELVGTLHQIDGVERVRVLLDLLGRLVLVSVPSKALIAI